MKISFKSFFVFLILALYSFSSSVLVHAESMKGMNMEEMGHGMEMNCTCPEELSTHIIKDTASSLECIEICVGEYDGYYVSQLSLKHIFFPKKILFSLDDIIYTKYIDVLESDADPPPNKIGSISVADFHKILVKVE